MDVVGVDDPRDRLDLVLPDGAYLFLLPVEHFPPNHRVKVDELELVAQSGSCLK